MAVGHEIAHVSLQHRSPQTVTRSGDTHPAPNHIDYDNKLLMCTIDTMSFSQPGSASV